MSVLDILKKKPTTAPTLPSQAQYTIMVVDDEVYLREFYEDLLTRQGYKVVTASNGQEALNMVAQNPPSLILLDIMMPVMDGLEVLRNLWENNMTKKIPVIVLTNAGDINNMDKAKFYSTYQFFVKSNVSPEDIVSAVSEALNVTPDGTTSA